MQDIIHHKDKLQPFIVPQKQGKQQRKIHWGNLFLVTVNGFDVKAYFFPFDMSVNYCFGNWNNNTLMKVCQRNIYLYLHVKVSGFREYVMGYCSNSTLTIMRIQLWRRWQFFNLSEKKINVTPALICLPMKSIFHIISMKLRRFNLVIGLAGAPTCRFSTGAGVERLVTISIRQKLLYYASHSHLPGQMRALYYSVVPKNSHLLPLGQFLEPGHYGRTIVPTCNKKES